MGNRTLTGGVRAVYDEDSILPDSDTVGPVCGNTVVESGETCDSTTTACADSLSGSTGTIYCCAETCSWNMDRCVTDSVCYGGSFYQYVSTFDLCVRIGTGVPPTEQMGCYDATGPISCPLAAEAFAGQDAQYFGGKTKMLASYSESVYDQQTGLSWQRTFASDYSLDGYCASVDGCTWAEAQSFCAAQNWEGVSDWRLPTDREIDTILHFGMEPMFDPDFFQNIPANYGLWTTIEVPDMTGYAYQVYTHSGAFEPYDQTAVAKVLCVSGTYYQPLMQALSLLHDNDPVWYDETTGLMWAPVSNTMATWENALAECLISTYAGYDDWRLPTANELRTIYDLSVGEFSGTEFPGDWQVEQWTSTTAGYSPEAAYVVNGMVGARYPMYKLNPGGVRCVR